MIKYDKFQMSLKRLEEQYANYGNLDASLPGLIQEAIPESIIQRFETCYDCLWKVLKRYLIEELGIADAPNSPKPIFRLAHENNLFAAPLEQWLKLRSMPASIRPTTTAARKRKPAWSLCTTSSTMPSAFTRP